MADDLQITDAEPQGHRAGAWVVLVMGVMGLAIGIYQWHGSFKAAFARAESVFKTPDQIEAARIQGLKAKDTDMDGLSDYDESYVFRTSPYLKDSDSDGVDDKTEVGGASDPNCPTGKSCGVEPAVPIARPTESASDTMDAAALQQQVADQLLNPTPAQVRAMLMQNGVKESELKDIDDATLLDLYRQSLQEVQTQASKTPSP